MKSTAKEVENILEELRGAMLEMMTASQKEEDAKLSKIKARHRLLLAREAVHNIEY
jgi:hypothetical protein